MQDELSAAPVDGGATYRAANRFGLPHLGIGVGLRSRDYAALADDGPAIDWLEVLSDNFLHTEGRPLYFLDRIAERYPVALHGVGMSLGSTDPLDAEYLTQLKGLRRRTRARWVSDHLSWSGVAGRTTHDLLPMPYTAEALRHMVSRVRKVQDFLGERIAVENPSTYVELASSTIPEWDFLAELAEAADCALLLDVNNVYVSAHNHGFDPYAYLKRIPLDRVLQFHVAGHTHCGTHIVDTHRGPVIEAVWQLVGWCHQRAPASVLLEWDEDVPALDRVHEEALLAKGYLDYVEGREP